MSYAQEYRRNAQRASAATVTDCTSGAVTVPAYTSRSRFDGFMLWAALEQARALGLGIRASYPRAASFGEG